MLFCVRVYLHRKFLMLKKTKSWKATEFMIFSKYSLKHTEGSKINEYLIVIQEMSPLKYLEEKWKVSEILFRTAQERAQGRTWLAATKAG